MIPSGIMEAVLMCALALLGFLLKHEFSQLNSNLEKINGTLGEATNRLVALETWKVENERLATQRHEENKTAIARLEDKIDQRKPRRKS